MVTREYYEKDNYDDFIYESFHENGLTNSKGEYRDGMRSGLWEWWHENGAKIGEATYDSGLFVKERRHWDSDGSLSMVEKINGKCSENCCDGTVTSYFPNGQIKSVCSVIGGARNGKSLYYYESGEPFSEETYFNDKIEGKYLEWYKNKTIWVNGFFSSNQMDSIWTWYDSLGIPTKRQLFENGEFVKDLE